MLSADIRNKFLRFFEDKGHTRVASDMLVPRNDPTLLFTGAGMNQFKDQFMGKDITFERATSCQKCLRTGDLENVGRTPRHHTFFEMLGNFSFGDYFKAEAIRWGWEFMTEVMGIPQDRLWVSVYKDDEESYGIWRDEVKISEDRIVRLGAKDNFWPADAPTKGPNGPCGPCSEIFFDLGHSPGGECDVEGCGPECGCGRFLEVWNLVFTEFERKPDGSLVPLPNKNIDTGMGLERITAVMQGVDTNFGTDIFSSIIESIRNEMGEAADSLGANDIYLVADHIRAVVFSICDGVSPSNEKQGYVIRKLIRRAYLKNKKNEPFLYRIVPVVVEKMKDVYPELEEKREHISAIIKAEEEKFGDTLRSAMPVLEDILSRGGKELKGEDIFLLVDTYGLPLETIEDKVVSAGVKLDMDGFDALMADRKEQSRKGSNIDKTCIFTPDLFKGVPVPEMSDNMPLDSEVIFILKDGSPVDAVLEGEAADVVLSPQSTEFYSAGGGQVGDKGTIKKEGALMAVEDTCDAGGRKVMKVSVKKGSFQKGDKVTLVSDADIRSRTACNHTATHLLQAALRSVLGEQVKQAGSLVDPEHLRFDFTHMRKVEDRDLGKIEDMVNGWIAEAMPVCKEVMSIKEAKEKGALSFFGEKYGETVRMVSAGDISRELCGGTHVDSTGEIGMFKIMSESSIASGVRRIEALTGVAAAEWIKNDIGRSMEEFEKAFNDPKAREDAEKKVEGLAAAVKAAGRIIDNTVGGPEIVHEYSFVIKPGFDRMREYISKVKKERQKTAEAGLFNEVKTKVDALLDKNEILNGVRYAGGAFRDIDASVLRKAVVHAAKKIGSGVVVLGTAADGKASILCSISPDLVEKGYSARKIVNSVAGIIAGGGGGNDAFAQAGGRDPEGLAGALDEARRIVEETGETA